MRDHGVAALRSIPTVSGLDAVVRMPESVVMRRHP
jgi:hypothetical protein